MSWHPLPTTNPVASKEHQCDLCLTTIDKGEKYVYCSGFFDGQFSVTKMHDWCNDLAAKITEEWDEADFESCSIAVAFEEWIHDHYREWGIDEAMHIHHLLRQLRKWKVKGDERRVEMTCRAIRAQLESYTGNLIDRERVLQEVAENVVF